MIKAIIFDFDGVLVESINIKTRAFKKLFESEGSDIADKVETYHLDNTGVSRFEKFRYIYRNILELKLDENILSDLCNRFSKLVVGEVVKAPYVKGAREFLEDCNGKYTFFIISATPQYEIENIIKNRKIVHFFKSVYGSPQKKEDAVRKIICDNKLKSSEIVYIGDASSDFKAAKANSIYFIARIYQGNEDIFKNIDCIKIDNLLALDAVIADLKG